MVSDPLASYRKIYDDLRFERSGLFALLQEEFHPGQVLYPGCSVHLTPAFYFPHVVFVDRAPATRDFFSAREALLDLVNRRKIYRRTSHLEFIQQDFTLPLPFAPGQFDLVLALWTGGVAKACSNYLKVGGLLLTNNHKNDAVEASLDDGLALLAVIQQRQGKYQRLAPHPPSPSGRGNRLAKCYLRHTGREIEYVEDECYYLFQRKQPRRP